MILRILLILIAAVLLARLLGWVPPALRRPKSPVTPESSAGTLVRCARCGLSVPQEEAISRGSRWYCSINHLTEDAS